MADISLNIPPAAGVCDIMQRYATRAQAEKYRDRFGSRKHLATHHRELRALAEALQKIGRVEAILDVGCGPGRFVPLLTAMSPRLFQLDYSRHMLEVNRQDHVASASLRGHVQGSATDLPFADGAVDVVLCHRLLNHIPESAARKRMLAELGRVASRCILISCLSPPRPLRLIRRLGQWLRGRPSTDGNVEEADLLREAAEAGLRLAGRVNIRRFPAHGDFLILQR